MTIIIQQNGTKRTLTGAFELLGDRHDLVRIARQILEQADRDDFFNGWIEIHPRIRGGENRQPIDWQEQGPSPSGVVEKGHLSG